MRDILQEINHYKRTLLEDLKKKNPIEALKDKIKNTPQPLGFEKAIRHTMHQESLPPLIAEIKKASPSRGIIQENFHPIDCAKQYQRAGACCLSILTEDKYFHGDLHTINHVKKQVLLPVLRKDFMVDEWQIYESRAYGADAILLILASLSDKQAHTMEEIALTLGMDVLIETHDEQEIIRAQKMQSPLIGVNNRNLKTLEVSLENGKKLLSLIDHQKIAIAESGIATHDDIVFLQKHHAKAFLIGESLMRQDNLYDATYKILHG